MDIKPILEAAICAPSGDNCQPWRLTVKDNKIHIVNIQEKDTSLYNFRQRASFIAHGALIENIAIASSVMGHEINTDYFPDKRNPNHIATVELIKSSSKADPLYSYIPQRTTNRTKYKPLSLKEEQKKAVLNAPGALGYGAVKLLEGSEKDQLSATIKINDRLVFENYHLHKFLFDHIRWTEREARATRDGLDIRTLEIPPSQAVGFKFLKNWPLVKTLNYVGLSKMVAMQAEQLCKSASALGMVTIQGDTDEDFVKGGRLVQRVWLEATRAGLSFQPVTGITFLMQRILSGATEALSLSHVSIIKKDVRQKLISAFGIKDETVAMLFRIGYSGPPSARSLRHSVDEVTVSSG